jgi:RNA ligase
MIEELKKLELEGYVRSVKHKDLPLTIWNYTPKTQYEKAFGDFPILRSCRGLVLDDEGKIVSYPFQKFHNWEELQPSERPCPGDKIEVTLKMDGSLIIVSKYNGELIFNTRGSFSSDQSLASEQLFYELGYNPDWVEDGVTVLFEYVAPENRIVVSYSQPNLVHLGRVETSTGRDLPRDSRFECVPVYEINGGVFGDELYSLFKEMDMVNKEGIVIRQVIEESRQNFRMKLKTELYRKQHFIMTNLSSIDVWDYIKENKSFDDMIEILPDEFCNWLRATITEIQNNFKIADSNAKNIFDIVSKLPSRKEQAEFLNINHEHERSVVFKMLDGQCYNDIIWKMVKPEKTYPSSNS